VGEEWIMKAIKALSIALVFLLESTSVYAFPPIVSSDQVAAYATDLTISPATGAVPFRATIKLCTGKDVSSEWGTISPAVFLNGIPVASCAAGTTVPLCMSGVTGCPHPPGSQCTPYICTGTIPLPADPRTAVTDSAVAHILLDFVVTPANPAIAFLNPAQAAVAASLRNKQRSDYLAGMPNVLDTTVPAFDAFWAPGISVAEFRDLLDGPATDAAPDAVQRAIAR
jgi:hypothetical protein